VARTEAPLGGRLVFPSAVQAKTGPQAEKEMTGDTVQLILIGAAFFGSLL
jgi:hypothetical protein